MGLDLNYSQGQTPIDEGEKLDLKLRTISTRNELDEFEQANIEMAVEWSLRNKFNVDRILTRGFIQEVHRRMFSEVWRWAGVFRKTNKNIGVDKVMIDGQLQMLLDDARIWISESVFPADEISIRFKHRLVSIHPFSNGNGRHSRLCADILVSHVLGQEVFSWGRAGIWVPGEARARYLEALHHADEGDFGLLLEFARS